MTNQEILRSGIDVFLEAMRSFVRVQLIKAFPSSWWEDGVLKALPDNLKDGIKRRASQGLPQWKFLEPRDVKFVIERNLSKIFDVGNDPNEIKAWLQQVVNARNLRGARGVTDVDAGLVEFDLTAMQMLLKAARLTDAATQISELKKMLSGTSVTPADTATPTLTPLTTRLPTGPMDTMIQDVNAENARIYFDGLMYVGGKDMMVRPDYFAPYFTKECAHSSRVPEVTASGISRYSRVLRWLELPLAELRQLDKDRIADLVPPGPFAVRWRDGLESIVAREKRERWSADYDPHRLYLLDTPNELGRTIGKDGYLSQIPHGFGTAFQLLHVHATTLRELKLH